MASNKKSYDGAHDCKQELKSFLETLSGSKPTLAPIQNDIYMKIGDRVKTKNKPWSPLDSWIVEGINGDRVYLARYKGCGMSATVRSIDTLELIDDYFSKR